MSERPKLRQQANNQTQAGAAAQLVVNIFFVSAGADEWVVKPIAFHVDGAVAPLGARMSGSGGEPAVEVEMDAGRKSNAQGQGLTVVNDITLLDILDRAIDAAARDPDIQNALREGR